MPAKSLITQVEKKCDHCRCMVHAGIQIALARESAGNECRKSTWKSELDAEQTLTESYPPSQMNTAASSQISKKTAQFPWSPGPWNLKTALLLEEAADIWAGGFLPLDVVSELVALFCPDFAAVVFTHAGTSPALHDEFQHSVFCTRCRFNQIHTAQLWFHYGGFMSSSWWSQMNTLRL